MTTKRIANFCLLLGWCCYGCTSGGTGPEDQRAELVNKSVIRSINEGTFPGGRDTLAIIHSRIVTGDGATVIEDGCVLIYDSLIHAVGPYGEVSIPEGSNMLNASGLTLLPGLIDAHFHLNRLDSLPTALFRRGITSARDPGAWIEDYEPQMASGRPLPRLYLTGPHLDMFPPAYPRNSFILRDPSEASAAVNQFVEQGASAIKVYFRSSLEIIQAICATADERGVPVTAHLEITDIYDAVEVGIDGIEHITSVGSNLVPPRTAEAYKQAILHDNNARRLGRYSMWHEIDPDGKEALQLGRFLSEKGVFVCPTLGAFEYRPTEEVMDTLRHIAFQNMMRYTKRLHEMGVRVVVGSHSLVRYADYGWAFHHEMELFEELGMAPLEIIRAATLDNAEFFSIADQLGSIEAGKVADLILVAGNPLDGIEKMRELQKVMVAGRWVF